MTFLTRAVRWLILLALLLGVGAAILFSIRPRPSATFDLAAPPGLTIRRAIVALETADACPTLLDRSGVAYERVPPRHTGECGFDGAVSWKSNGSRQVAVTPARPALACPLAAALAAWEWSVVQPAAARAFGTTVTRIDHFGSYACRRIYGRSAGNWSEHARANAFDVAGFRLADSRRITVAADWKGSGAEARFLHEVRDGACRLFGTTLSPDYNAAHRDHLHLDGADRDGFGYCR